MDRFKSGDIAYHKAGNKLLGTICGINENKVIVRRIETLNEIEVYPDELKLESEIAQEDRNAWAELHAISRQPSFDPYD